MELLGQHRLAYLGLFPLFSPCHVVVLLDRLLVIQPLLPRLFFLELLVEQVLKVFLFTFSVGVLLLEDFVPLALILALPLFRLVRRSLQACGLPACPSRVQLPQIVSVVVVKDVAL